jgi:hypothetical protein
MATPMNKEKKFCVFSLNNIKRKMHEIIKIPKANNK